MNNKIPHSYLMPKISAIASYKIKMSIIKTHIIPTLYIAGEQCLSKTIKLM